MSLTCSSPRFSPRAGLVPTRAHTLAQRAQAGSALYPHRQAPGGVPHPGQSVMTWLAQVDDYLVLALISSACVGGHLSAVQKSSQVLAVSGRA